MCRVDPHALDLTRVVSDPSHAARTDGGVVLERKKKTPVRGLELGDRGDVVPHGLFDREPKPVPRLEFVVAPREVVEPQVPDDVEIARQDSIPNVRHVVAKGSAAPPGATHLARRRTSPVVGKTAGATGNL